MKISIVAASPDTQAQHLHLLLQRAGLAQALATATGLTPDTWHSKLYQALEQTDPSATQHPLVVGKAWQDLASGIVIANLDQDQWGFADSRSTWTLDFWAQLDPQTRFVLAYTQPDHLDLSAPQALATWLAYNSQLLRFYKANKTRAVLVNTSQVLAHPHRFVHTCHKLLGLTQLDWQPLQHDTPVAPTTFVPNPAALKLGKQLASACTQLLNPNTALVATQAPRPSKGKLAELFGIFGKARQLSELQEQLQRTQAEQVQATEELAQANQLLAELAAQKQTLQQQKQSHQEEGELLLAQLHQVQEELEKHFLTNKQTQEQLAQTKVEADKAKNDKAAADKAKADLDAKLKQAEAAKAKAEADKAAADKAKADADKAKADLDAKLKQAEAAKAKAEADKTKAEADKAAADKAKADLDAKLKQAEAAKAKAEADKTKAEADKAAADKAKAEADKAKAEADKAKLDATQEGELLLQQLHQVQEELENYYLKNKQLEQSSQAHQTTQERLTRVLARLPTWADAHTLLAQLAHNEANHQALRIQAQQVWIGQNKPIADISLELGVRRSVPYMQLAPTPELPNGLDTQDRVAMALLNTTQWRTVRSLLGLVPVHMPRLQAVPAKDHAFWYTVVKQLAATFEALAKHLRYDHADAITVSTPAAGQETLRLALRNLEMGSYRNPMLVLDVGLHTKTSRGKTKTTQVHFDFRQWKEGAAPFAVWSPNQQDDNGKFLRISFDIAKHRLNMADIQQLSPQDQAVLVALVQAMPIVCEELDLSRFTLNLGLEMWGTGLLQAATLAEYELLPQAQDTPAQEEAVA